MKRGNLRSLIIKYTPGFLMGITFQDWMRMLKQENHQVDPPFMPKVIFITLFSLMNSILRFVEQLLFGRQVARVNVPPPLFILGAGRSGTTLLQRYLALDHRYAFPTMFEVRFPHCFLTMEWCMAPVLNIFVKGKRFQDNVEISVKTPDEDEIALHVQTGLSSMLGLVFPRDFSRSMQYIDFSAATSEEISLWKSAFIHFLQKLTWKHHRPIILKSPMHTARIPILLEMFPDARFLVIHRHPYDVLRSRIHMQSSLGLYQKVQNSTLDLKEVAFLLYVRVCQAYFRTRHLVPSTQLTEIRFEDLERDPVQTLKEAYQNLNLPDFSVIEPQVRQLAQRNQSYRKNVHQDIDPALKERLWQDCPEVFLEWNYER